MVVWVGFSIVFYVLFPPRGSLGICASVICLLGEDGYVVWLLAEVGEEGGVIPLGGVNNGNPLLCEEEEKGYTLPLRGDNESSGV